MKYYELSDGDRTGSSLPEAHFCHEYKATGPPLSGMALLPPQSLDVANVEIARVLRLTPTTVEPGGTRESAICMRFSVEKTRGRFELAKPTLAVRGFTAINRPPGAPEQRCNTGIGTASKCNVNAIRHRHRWEATFSAQPVKVSRAVDVS